MIAISLSSVWQTKEHRSIDHEEELGMRYKAPFSSEVHGTRQQSHYWRQNNIAVDRPP